MFHAPLRPRILIKTLANIQNLKFHCLATVHTEHMLFAFEVGIDFRVFKRRQGYLQPAKELIDTEHSPFMLRIDFVAT